MFRMNTRLKLTGFLESSTGEPGLLLQIQWRDNHLALSQCTWPGMVPVVQEDAVYSSLHLIPYHSLSTFPPSELDLLYYFSGAGFEDQCSLYLAPKIASFVSDLASSFAGVSPPSFFIFAQLKTLNNNFFRVHGIPHPIYPPTEQLVPRRHDPYHQPQGDPLSIREFFHNTVSYDSREVHGTEGGQRSERNESRTRGASKQAIARLKEPVLSREDKEAGECSVCLQEMSGIRDVLAMPCDHIFHKTCILTWLQSKKSCPLCRSQLHD